MTTCCIGKAVRLLAVAGAVAAMTATTMAQSTKTQPPSGKDALWLGNTQRQAEFSKHLDGSDYRRLSDLPARQGTSAPAPRGGGCSQPEANCQLGDGLDGYNISTFRVADNFTPSASGLLTSLCWHAIYFSNNGSQANAFTVTIYGSNANGIDESNVLGVYTEGVNMTVGAGVPTGELLLGFYTEYSFSATIDAPDLKLQAGQCYYIELHNTLTGDVMFWETATGGDGFGYQTDASGFFDISNNTCLDYAFCTNLPMGDASTCTPDVGGRPENDVCGPTNPEVFFQEFVLGSNVNANTDTVLTNTLCGAFPLSGGSSDVFYRFTPTTTQVYRISTCGTAFDSVLSVHAGCPADEANLIGCNDDAACGSEVRAELNAGVEYYIRVASYTACLAGQGEFQLYIDTPPVCGDCPKGAIMEKETECGLPDDFVNGGCNSPTPVFTDIEVGATICGTIGTNGSTRDTDWYRVVLTEATQLTWTLTAEFPGQIAMLYPDCNFLVVSGTGLAGNECEPLSFSVCVPAGTYYVLALPSVFGGFDCGARYVATLEGFPCKAPALPNDSCDTAEVISPGGTSSGDTTFAQYDVGLDFCNGVPTGPGVWYTLTGNGNQMTVSTCGSSYDTAIYVYCGSNGCEDLSCIGTNDDGGGCGLNSSFSFCTENGGTYYVFVGGYAGSTGAYTLSLTDNGTCTTAALPCLTVGACCTSSGCEILTPAACATAGGVYQGNDTNCGNEQSYAHQTCGNAFEDISGTGTHAAFVSNQDDNGEEVNIGFTFTFFGFDHTTIKLCSNGYATFGNNLTAYTNSPTMPNTAGPNDMIAVYWDDFDLDSDGGNGDVHYQTMGSAPNRRFIAQWTEAQHWGVPGQRATFQFVLYEGSNNIEYRYLMTDARDTPTVGIEDSIGLNGLQIPTATLGGCESILASVSENPCKGGGCACDFNGDNLLNSQDFFDFLNCFFVPSCTDADYNADGAVNSQDFFDFLNCFFAPPAGC